MFDYQWSFVIFCLFHILLAFFYVHLKKNPGWLLFTKNCCLLFVVDSYCPAQNVNSLCQIGFSESCIMSTCVKPTRQCKTNPVARLHCFDSSCLEWRCTYPLLEEVGLEVWAVDVLGWGFSDLVSNCSASNYMCGHCGGSAKVGVLIGGKFLS